MPLISFENSNLNPQKSDFGRPASLDLLGRMLTFEAAKDARNLIKEFGSLKGSDAGRGKSQGWGRSGNGVEQHV